MDKATILYLSSVSFFKGGAERSLFDLLANPHIAPVLVVPEEGALSEQARALGIPFHVVDFGMISAIRRPFSFAKGFMVLKSLWRSAGQMRAISRKENAAIIHSNGPKAHAINCIAKWRGGTKAILHFRDIPYTRAEKLVWQIFSWMSNGVVLVSRACWPLPTLPDKVRVIHNGTPLIDRPYEVDISADVITLGFIGRIHPSKGLHLLLEWLAAARAKGINVRVSVRGMFSEDAPDYRGRIMAQIEQSGIAEHVSFEGFIDDREMLYQGLDVVVVPSETPDPLPRAVMESMARGIPVFGYPAGGIHEMITDQATGFLVKDTESFMKALTFITDNPDKRAVLITQARHKITQEFTIEGLHDATHQLYTTI